MKKRSVAILLMVYVLMITGCGNSNSVEEPIGADSQIMDNTDQTDTEENISTEYSKEAQTLLEVSQDKLPFEIQMDKTALRTKNIEQTTVLIITELTDWSYNVQAEYGRVTNIEKNSFDYSIPKDNEQREDTITIQLVNNENGKQYDYVIPLIFASFSNVPIAN